MIRVVIHSRRLPADIGEEVSWSVRHVLDVPTVARLAEIDVSQVLRWLFRELNRGDGSELISLFHQNQPSLSVGDEVELQDRISIEVPAIVSSCRWRCDAMGWTEVSPKSVQDQIQEIVDDAAKRWAVKWPGLVLSFGYIGNYWTDGRQRPDDRSWRVFVALPGKATRSFGGYDTHELPEMLDGLRAGKLEEVLAKWQWELERR